MTRRDVKIILAEVSFTVNKRLISRRSSSQSERDGRPTEGLILVSMNKLRTDYKAVAVYEAELKKRSGATREQLKHRLKLVESRIEKMKEVLNEQQDRGTAIARNFQEFNLARKEYQTALSNKDQLQVKYDIAKTKLALPPINHIIHEEPRRPTIPVTKGRDFFTTLFTLVALPLAAMGAFTLIYLAEAIFPRRMVN